MSNKISYLLNREKGQYPISIATSLALESLMNIHPDNKHQDVPKERFTELWCNIRTLFRNLYTSMDRLSAESLEIEDYMYGLMDDIHQLQDWGNLPEVNIPIVFYHSHYENHKQQYPYAKLRDDTTVIQRTYSTKMEHTIHQLFKSKQLSEYKPSSTNELSFADTGVRVYVFKDKISPVHYPNVGMLTHYCYDLLDYYAFSKLLLVESHIGNIKDKTQWYTKYYNGNKLPPIPFCKELLQIFGDKEMFSPAPKNIRDKLLQVAEKYQWTPMTTKERMLVNLQLMPEVDIAAVMTAIFHS